MIASSSQRTGPMTVFKIDWFLLADCLKLAVAFFLLLLMMCVSYEDIIWLQAIRKTQSALTANANLPVHLTAYTQTGEEWRLWQEALSIANPITNLLNGLEASPAAPLLSLFAPQLKQSIDGISQVSQRFSTVESGLRGLAQSSSIMVASAQFTSTPTHYMLLEFASVCRGSIAQLQNIEVELLWMTPLAAQISSGFAASVDFLEDKTGYLPPITQVDYLVDMLRQGALEVKMRSESLQHYQQILQQDVQMMNAIVTIKDNAQKTTDLFGNGAWRRLMIWVRENAILLLFANLSLFVAEICLFMEQKNKVPL